MYFTHPLGVVHMCSTLLPGDGEVLQVPSAPLLDRQVKHPYSTSLGAGLLWLCRLGMLHDRFHQGQPMLLAWLRGFNPRYPRQAKLSSIEAQRDRPYYFARLLFPMAPCALSHGGGWGVVQGWLTPHSTNSPAFAPTWRCSMQAVPKSRQS